MRINHKDKKKSYKAKELKNVIVKIEDLVKRNYNPKTKSIIATDVSYIPANVEKNHIYLSAAINHKTKLIEAWKLSVDNDSKVVIDTLDQISKTNFILHSDHGSAYSSQVVLEKVKKLKAKSSMSRIANSLDNREIEYFFGCLRGEYLNHIETKKLSIIEIEKHIN